MRKLVIAAIPLAFALAACDGDRENVGEKVDQMNGQGELAGKGPAETAGEQADMAARQEANGMKQEADAIRADADKQADAIDKSAKELDKTTR